METGQSTDHDNTDGKTVPETTESNLGVDTGDSGTSSLGGELLSVDLRDHDISGVRDNSAEDTSNVTTEERDTSLGKERVLFLRLRQVVVDGLDSLLERSELNHGVRNLTGPQRRETLVEGTESFSSSNLLVSIENRGGKGRDRGLGLDLNGFPRTKQDIGNQFSRGRGRKVDKSTVLVGSLLTNEVRVLLLEKLVETVLTGTLERVTDDGSTETSPDTTESLSSDDRFPGLEVTSVETRVNLSAALDEIERSDSSVSRATG